MKKLAPSILSADFSRLGEDVSIIEKAGADYIHVDVMDGHFVPNISYGATVMKSLIGKTNMKFDVHLMIEDPDKYIKDFVTENTEYITVHQEACIHLNRTVSFIKEQGVKAGVSINPATSLAALDFILEEVDLVLIMSVNPGFGGQKFIDSALEKVKALDEIRKNCGLNFEIEIDGGINLNNIKDVIVAGVDIVVAGSSVFKAGNIEDATRTFLEKLK